MNNLQLKIITYNLHKGFNLGGTDFVLKKMKTMIQETGADLVFLQEIQGEHEKHSKNFCEWPDTSQFEYLADEIWPHFAYAKNAVYQEGHHGNAILSKYPISAWENINVSPMKKMSRSILHAEIEIPGLPSVLHAICIHFGFLSMERKGQLKTLSDRISSSIPQNEPLILAGDFNDWRAKIDSNFEAQLSLKEVFKFHSGQHCKTFPSVFPILPLDRVYFRGLGLNACHGPRDKMWRKLSDHLPLFVEFDLVAGP